MNSKKQYPNDKLQKSSLIFLQLGLILALLFVYSVLESEYEKKTFADLTYETDASDLSDYPYIPVVVDDKKPEKKKDPKPKKKKLFSPDEIITDDNQPEPEDILDPDDSDSDAELTNKINSLPDMTEPEEDEKIESIFGVQSVPRFPGCENLTNDKALACFTKKISHFVNRKFNTGLASNYGLEGKQHIYVQFVIDKNGEVSNIIAKAPHASLEKEAQRIIEKLPKMTPGMQQNRPVPVKYTLPIRFVVE